MYTNSVTIKVQVHINFQAKLIVMTDNLGERLREISVSYKSVSSYEILPEKGESKLKENSYSKAKQSGNNKKAHSKNGNPEILKDDIKIIQINASNANFTTKIEELQVTIDKTKADIVIISEANVEVKNKDKMTERESKFTEFNIVDKTIGNNDKARVSMMISKKIKFKRVHEMEDDENPTIVIKIKEKLGKQLLIIGMYRQWKAPGEGGSNTAPDV